MIDTIEDFVKAGIEDNIQPVSAKKNVFWQNLQKTGTDLWLDTGDIDGATRLWSDEMSALTTNNTLLNREIQKGIYDKDISEANNLLKNLDLKERIIEIAFILNARHGLKLVNTFGAKVSVELHTDVAHDLERSIRYAERFHKISPTHFIIKIPLTPTGYLVTRDLREKGIPVNFTLNFSARQNLIAVIFSKPSFVNVFLGRLNAYAIDNQLGDGNMIGEKTTLASQRVVSEFSKRNPEPTRQIAASMRDASQVASLAGVDVFTMPLKVAQDAMEVLDDHFSSCTGKDYSVQLFNNIDPRMVKIEKLWDYTEREYEFANSLDKDQPDSSEEFLERAHQAGLQDLFPNMTDQELNQIVQDGKIPHHKYWYKRISDNTLSIDALTNLAGLASFSADQRELDERIRSIISK
jgi:transaldolase